ncbi:hypothetical protein H9Q72_003581 [Fusarium xylarioides]|uniref:Intradiol ring-cleavage dioxygenases domain-containing protein n=1 Tax=Fusarium xylarioides TaxID=221167 RepID=A0A9P7L9F1_9HYPO|nr:hypothetical protein H9Q72_003581 [Fusarium xylarioides]
MVKITSLVVSVLTAASLAHPGHHEDNGPNPVAKRAFLSQSRRALDACAGHLKARGTVEKAEAHRRALIKKYMKKGLRARDTDEVLAKDHHANLTLMTMNPDSFVFASNNTCVLSPEGEIGPFWVKGELVREDIVDNEPGVVNYMHAQFIDVNTCEPIQGIYWNVWNCNSTGAYSGVQSDSNGNGDDAANLDRTSLRGIQKTNHHGVAFFKSIFPGHYNGRATHVHVVAHTNATVLKNHTLAGGSVSHIGQLFFDQDLITEVEATYPYNTSNINITLNSEDRVFAVETEDTESDPVFNYVLLGDSVSDGIFSWLTIGVNTTATYSTSYAAYLAENGGVSNGDNAAVGAGGGGGTPAGTPTPASTA